MPRAKRRTKEQMAADELKKMQNASMKVEDAPEVTVAPLTEIEVLREELAVMKSLIADMVPDKKDEADPSKIMNLLCPTYQKHRSVGGCYIEQGGNKYSAAGEYIGPIEGK